MRSLDITLADLDHQPDDPCTGGLWEEVDQALTLLVRAGPEHLSPHTLRRELTWLARMQRRFEAASARWVAELGRAEQEQPPPPGKRCSDFLRETLDVTPSRSSGARSARRR